MRNKVLVIDIQETEDGKSKILVQHANRSGDNVTPTDDDYSIVSDMASLCEAICTMIHSAENEGIKTSPESLRDCINHLEKGTFDASYFGEMDFHRM